MAYKNLKVQLHYLGSIVKKNGDRHIYVKHY